MRTRNRRDAVLSLVVLLTGSAVFGLVFSGDPEPLQPQPVAPASAHAAR